VRPLRSVGAESPPPLDIPVTEDPDADVSYQVTEQVEQPPSPVLNPKPKPKPRQTTGPVTSPAQVQQRAMQPSASPASAVGGLPWWVWAIGIYLLTKKRR